MQRRVRQDPGALDGRLQHPDVDLGQTAARGIPEQKRRNRSSDTFNRRDLHLYMHTAGAQLRPHRRAIAPTSSRWIATGRSVYFTSDEQVTADDNDESVDLFMWEEASGEVTRLSTGDDGEAGNTDEAATSAWVAEMRHPDHRHHDRPLRQPEKKNSIRRTTGPRRPAKSTSTRPSSSTAATACADERNLYVYRNGAPQFVTTARPPRARRSG